jgi:hypothetical protein
MSILQRLRYVKLLTSTRLLTPTSMVSINQYVNIATPPIDVGVSNLVLTIWHTSGVVILTYWFIEPIDVGVSNLVDVNNLTFLRRCNIDILIKLLTPDYWHPRLWFRYISMSILQRLRYVKLLTSTRLLTPTSMVSINQYVNITTPTSGVVILTYWFIEPIDVGVSNLVDVNNLTFLRRCNIDILMYRNHRRGCQ